MQSLRNREYLRRVAFVHNHTSENPYSDLDLFHFFKEDAYLMAFLVVETGHVYWIKKYYLEQYVPHKVMFEWGVEFLTLFHLYQPLVLAGTMMEKEASKAQLHEIVLRMQRKIRFEYGRTDPVEEGTEEGVKLWWQEIP